MGHAGAGRREESQDGYGRLAAGVRLLHDHPARSGIVAGMGGKLERPLPLFTRLPRRVLLGTRASGIYDSRKLRGHKKSRGLPPPALLMPLFIYLLPVVKDQTLSETRELPALSLAPLVPPFTLA